MRSYLCATGQEVNSKFAPFLLSYDLFNGHHIASHIFGNFEKSLLRLKSSGKIDFGPHRCSFSDEYFNSPINISFIMFIVNHE